MNYTIPLSESVNKIGSLSKLEINHPAASAELFLQGAHLTQWQPAGQKPVLFVSGKSMFAPAKPIRGGVPICFPWFANHATDPNLPAHGFARTREWKVIDVKQSRDDVQIHLQLGSDHQTHELWGFDFVADFRVTIGKTLEMKFSVTNTGKSSITFEEALHTYYAVSDVRNITVSGLKGVTYLDKPNGMKRVVEEPGAISFAGETDRVYINTTHACTINDPGLKRKIIVEKSGSDSTVVWNPFEQKAIKAPDIGAENWSSYACVETANCFDNAVTLAAGRTHEMTARVRVESLV